MLPNVFCWKKPKLDDPIIDYQKQSRLMNGKDNDCRINVMNKNDKLVTYFYPNAKTLHDLFMKGLEISNNGYCYGFKPSDTEPFKWMKYSEVLSTAKEIGSAFAHLGLKPGAEEFVGIFARNCVEWTLTEQACNAYTYVTVPLYDTLGEEAVTHILTQCELKLCVCDNSAKAIDLMKRKSKLVNIIVFGEITSDARNKATETNINLLSFEDLKQIGRKNMIDIMPPSTNHLALICYTSGTTGLPKGAMISHMNIVASITSVLHYLHKCKFYKVGVQESYLSYLPLAHVMERLAQSTVLGMGGQIGFFRGDIKLLLEDIKEFKPTIFVTVPRLLNRIYSKIQENVEKQSKLKQKVFRWAYTNKEKEVLEGVVRNNGPYDFAFKTVRESLGGNVKIILTGSAPISSEVFQFMRVVSGCYVVEGYGATETGGASFMTVPGETSIGNVGPPLLCSIFKLKDVPEMGIVSKRDNKGEICIKGTNIFLGYYKDTEKTNAALIDDFYHTGDIGTIEPNGSLKIVDRVKNIFKLQQGEYIAPEKIENIYVKSIYVAQVFVYGDSLKNNLIAIVVPEESVICDWAKAKVDISDKSMISLCKNAELKALILEDIGKQGKSGGLKGFEQVRKIHLHHDLFSVESGLLTPTMKAKRIELKKYFQSEINELYSDLD